MVQQQQSTDSLPQIPYSRTPSNSGLYVAAPAISKKSQENSIFPYSNVPVKDTILTVFTFSDLKPSADSNQTHNPARVQVPSMFTAHKLHPKTFEVKPIFSTTDNWFVVILIFSFGIFTWIQWNYAKRLRQIIRAVFLPNQINQLERDGTLFAEPIRHALSFIYIISISFLIYKSVLTFFHYSLIPNNGFLSFLIIAGFLMLYRFLKASAAILIGKIFKTEKETIAFRLNSLIFSHVIGLLVFPFLAINFFQNSISSLWICIVLASILFIYRFFKNFSLGFSEKHYMLVYLFLYLCTLEILPMVLLLKYITIDIN